MKQIKKIYKRWNRIPRSYRSVCNIVIALVVVGLWYISNDCPALSPLHQFRRMERVNFVGPSTVLLNEKVEEYDHYAHFIVGETEHGVLTFAESNRWSGDLNYFKKTGDITVVSGPKSLDFWGDGNRAVKLPVVVVDNYPDAVYAQLEVSVDGFYSIRREDGIRLDHTFSAEATRKYDGCFLFSFDLPYLDNLRENGFTNPFIRHGAEGYALDALAFTFTNSGDRSYRAVIAATVRLYDEDGTLLTEQEQELAPNMRYWEP